MFQRLEDVEKRYDELTKMISDPEVISRQTEWQRYMKEHASMKLDGNTVHTNVDITYAQAVIGDKVKIKIFGEQVELDIPAGTREQDKITIAKKGYMSADSTRGDLVLHINIKYPQEITEREKKIYEQLLRVEKQQMKEKQKG